MAKRVVPAVWLSVVGLQLVLAGGCGPIDLGEPSPLVGTWRGTSAGPGMVFVGTFVFDYFGDLRRLEIIGTDWPLRFTFDGEPHRDSNGDEYVATSRTEIDENGEFTIKAFIEYNEGKREGLNWITVTGRVQYGSLSGKVRVAFPGADMVIEQFSATRS